MCLGKEERHFSIWTTAATLVSQRYDLSDFTNTVVKFDTGFWPRRRLGLYYTEYSIDAVTHGKSLELQKMKTGLITQGSLMIK
jgi:hypothetical protein